MKVELRSELSRRCSACMTPRGSSRARRRLKASPHRDASALFVALSLIGDGIRSDIETDSNRPIDRQNENEWTQLSRFPNLTWRMSASWRTALSRAADDLLHDLQAGSLPRPRCPAEEAVLYLAIEDAPGMGELVAPEIEALPRSQHDGQWDGMYDLLFRILPSRPFLKRAGLTVWRIRPTKSIKH